MTRWFEDDHAQPNGHRGFKLLSLAAGAVLAMLLVALGTRDIDAAAITEYFAPLSGWLEEQNKGQQCGW